MNGSTCVKLKEEAMKYRIIASNGKANIGIPNLSLLELCMVYLQFWIYGYQVKIYKEV